jgi:hypothetical protein
MEQQQSEKWEYRVEWLGLHPTEKFGRAQEVLNEYGSYGWELVNAAPRGDNLLMFVFKRRR